MRNMMTETLSTTPDSLDRLQARLREFARARDWEQYHSPKNLAMALIAEAAELVEHFQWLSEEQAASLPPAKKDEVALELADILIYLLRCADRLDVDLLDAAERKVRINDQRYPVDKVKGDQRRASEYQE